MESLNKNGVDYYKTKEYWTPAEAAGFVMGFEIDTVFYTPKDYEKIELVLNASIKAVDDKKLSIYKEIEEYSGFSNDFHTIYCSSLLCRQDDVYQKQYLSCFHPLEYMAWIISEKVIRIPERQGVKLDDEGNLAWIYPPDYKEEKGKTFGSEIPLVFEKRSKYFKGLKYWTIVEGACLVMGEFPREAAPYNTHGNLVDVIERAYAADEIQAILRTGQDWIQAFFNIRHHDETPCFSPFDLLECWKKAGFEIHPLFDFIKTVNDAGETIYRWVDDETSTQTQRDTKKDQPEIPNPNIICIDLEHQQLSKELKIAIQAWDAVYVRGKRSDKLGHLDNIKEWLKNNYPSLKDTPLKRIATVVNPNKAGGAPSSSPNQ